jgi:hypothetical protein
MYNFLGKNWEISFLNNFCLTKIEKLAGSLTVKLCPVWPQSASPAASVFTNFRERTTDSAPRRKGITLSSSPPVAALDHWIVFSAPYASVDIYNPSYGPCSVLFFYSATSLKQRFTGRHATPLWHIILTPNQPVLALSP